MMQAINAMIFTILKKEIDKHKNNYKMSPFCQKKKEHFLDHTR